MGITLGGMMSGPMAGVRVIELGVWVAGPAAAGLLADWGADVIKLSLIHISEPTRLLSSACSGVCGEKK